MLDEDEDYFDPTLPIWKHPKVRKNPRTIGAALFLLFTGIVFFFISISLFSASDNSRAVVFIVVSALTLIPGGYITFYIWMTLKGEPGYYFSAIPNFDS
ncbi:hypothetical protein BKA69DRAFT_1078943 [Paraphysoderma sedebokerense]|nr:hypothetical protein BKA69DRAFT_1078943 [Paraphysoderma sedebokerense]